MRPIPVKNPIEAADHPMTVMDSATIDQASLTFAKRHIVRMRNVPIWKST